METLTVDRHRTAGPIRRGTPVFRRSSLALFAGGFGTFAMLYCVQTLLPVLARDFRVSPAESSLALSLATGAISVMVLVAGTAAETFGRRAVMLASLGVAALLTLACALTIGFHQLLVLRLLTGVALSGLPASLVAYIGEEFDPGSVGYALGLSIAGNALGGMSGRFLAAALAELGGWRLSLGALGAIGLVCTVLFWRLLPPSRRFEPQPFRPGRALAGLGRPFRDPGLRWLFVSAFLFMGSFVTLYNYAGFRLMAAPFGLSQTAIGGLFTIYLIGMAASTWGGSLADRFGRRRVLWPVVAVLLAGTQLTRAPHLLPFIVGIALATAAFFAAHAIASSWLTRRAAGAKAQTAALYMFFLYLGSSVMGTWGGVVLSTGGWGGLVSLLGVMQLAALAVALRLAFLAPLAREAGR